MFSLHMGLIKPAAYTGRGYNEIFTFKLLCSHSINDVHTLRSTCDELQRTDWGGVAVAAAGIKRKDVSRHSGRGDRATIIASDASPPSDADGGSAGTGRDDPMLPSTLAYSNPAHPPLLLVTCFHGVMV